MALLDRDAILARDDLPRELVAVPEWGGEVYVRGLTVLERDRHEVAVNMAMAVLGSSRSEAVRGASMRAQLLAKVICDADGRPLFDATDAEALAGKSTAATERIIDTALRLSNMEDETAEASAIERAVGNSGGGRSAASSSDSPSPSERR